MPFWWIWLPALAVTSVLALYLMVRRAERGWRIVAGALLLAVLLYPLERWLAHRLMQWLFATGASPLADWLMAARQHRSLRSYLFRTDRVLGALQGLLGLLGLGVGAGWAYRRGDLARGWRNRWIRGGVVAAVTLLVAFVGFNLWLDHAFRQPHPVFYMDCHKVWGHRGHPEPPKIIENTIPSFRHAFDLGAPGVEMDVRYDRERREYYIGRYDRGPAPPPGQRLTLDEVFAAVGQRGYFWLDTKTIHYMTPEEARQAAQDMAALLDKYGLRERAIIESDTPERLVYFARAGLHTSYWIFNIDESRFPKTPWGLWWALVRIKWNYIHGGFSAISLDVRFYKPLVAYMLRGARIHLFTINTPEELRTWAKRDEVRVILTDTDRYDITTCGEER